MLLYCGNARGCARCQWSFELRDPSQRQEGGCAALPRVRHAFRAGRWSYWGSSSHVSESAGPETGTRLSGAVPELTGQASSPAPVHVAANGQKPNSVMPGPKRAIPPQVPGPPAAAKSCRCRRGTRAPTRVQGLGRGGGDQARCQAPG